jgi:hypothetical protein
MIKQYTAFTKEVDDSEAAVKQILEQLKLEENKLKNTFGIIHFNYEFVNTGVCKAIVDALPFELAGCVSSYVGTRGQYAEIAMSVTMLTSDDVHFSIRTVENVSTKSREQISDEVKQVFVELSREELPKMIIPFMNLQRHFSGDDLVIIGNSLQNPIPLFGTLAFDMKQILMTQTENTHYLLANKNISSDIFTFVAFYGNVEPKFHCTTTFDFEESFDEPGEVTAATGPILHTVSGLTALEYLKKQGIIDADNKTSGSGMWTIPAILTYPNGLKIVRSFIMIVKDTESILASGYITPGAKIVFALLDADKTVSSAEKMMKKLIESNEKDIIAYSCVARAWALGTQHYAEVQKITECAQGYEQNNNELYNYCVSYSGGEICPVWDKDGKMINTLHNYTLITCTFN